MKFATGSLSVILSLSKDLTFLVSGTKFEILRQAQNDKELI